MPDEIGSNPLFPKPDRPTDEDKKEAVDLTDYNKFAQNFEEKTGESLNIDDSRPAPIPKAPTAEQLAPGIKVKYNGYATLRVITPSQWKDVGIHDMGRKEWNHLNKYKIPATEFSEKALAYLLEQDGRFEFVED